MRGGRARYEEFWALQDVSLEVPAGTTFGLIGENGSGKSTLLKCMARILRPDQGSIATDGKVSALLELGAGFHPELSGRENVYLNGAILGLGKKRDRRPLRRHRRVRRPRAVHRHAGEELLVGHVRAARLLGRDQRRPRHPPRRRGPRGRRRRVPAPVRREVRRAPRRRARRSSSSTHALSIGAGDVRRSRAARARASPDDRQLASTSSTATSATSSRPMVVRRPMPIPPLRSCGCNSSTPPGTRSRRRPPAIPSRCGSTTRWRGHTATRDHGLGAQSRRARGLTAHGAPDLRARRCGADRGHGGSPHRPPPAPSGHLRRRGLGR